MTGEAVARPRGVGAAASFDVMRGRWIERDFWFDEAAADGAVAFFATYIRFTKGEWAGRPFVLEAWQEDDIIRPLFGWKRLDDDTRRYRRCFVWVPRKNGKTELAAGVALLVLLGDAEEGGEVYAIASSGDQAEIVFGQASRMVDVSPELGEHLNAYKTSIYCPALNAGFKPLTGKAHGKHGLNCSGLIGDEMHEWPDGELYQFVHDAQSARRQPLEFMISTAGKRGTYGEELYEECLSIQDGSMDDPTTLVVIYAAHPDDDWLSEETWRKANPNLGISKKLETMRTEAMRAKRSPRVENWFKNYQLNVWTEQAVRWLPINSVDDNGRAYGWDHCVGPYSWQDLEERLRGKLCFGGLDLSSSTDLSALAWWFPIQDGLELPVLLARFWMPADLVQSNGRRDRLPYEDWVRQGALMTTPGKVIDYSFIRHRILEDCATFRVPFMGERKREKGQGGLAVDRWNALETVTKLVDEGVPVEWCGQGYATLSAPAKELERLVLSNGFHHGGHPIMHRHATVVAVEQDAPGNIKPAKHKSTQRIDGIAAAVNAIWLATGNRAVQEKAYQMLIFG